ncbi:DRTGG domain-containing protein [Dendrosporobacter sp. 1207_IL3150]|uniref:DRTGG domain-containing protein n=1 Tax=Dendrosporobacter sp. 1207_IL3150 TaxID=3084054 RepID=UPI002FD931D6
MLLAEVQQTLQAEVLCGKDLLEREVDTVCGADLMSDVLAFAKDRTLLLTGLINIQVVRTAFLSDLVGIVFVRGKRPNSEIIEMAGQKGIPVMVSSYTMYEACGRLYLNGVGGKCESGDSIGK